MLVPTDPNVIGMYLRLYKDHSYRGLAELVLSVPELVASFDKEVAGAPFNPKGILLNSCQPEGVLNAVFPYLFSQLAPDSIHVPSPEC